MSSNDVNNYENASYTVQVEEHELVLLLNNLQEQIFLEGCSHIFHGYGDVSSLDWEIDARRRWEVIARENLGKDKARQMWLEGSRRYLAEYDFMQNASQEDWELEFRGVCDVLGLCYEEQNPEFQAKWSQAAQKEKDSSEFDLVVTTEDRRILDLAALMKTRCLDTSTVAGSGLVVTIRSGECEEATLAVMPFKLFDAIRQRLSTNPSQIDPAIPDGEFCDLDDEQRWMLAAFIRLELGFDTEKIEADLAADNETQAD